MIYLVIGLILIIVVLSIIIIMNIMKPDHTKVKELKKIRKELEDELINSYTETSEAREEVESTLLIMEDRLIADDGVINENIPKIITDIKHNIRY